MYIYYCLIPLDPCYDCVDIHGKCLDVKHKKIGHWVQVVCHVMHLYQGGRAPWTGNKNSTQKLWILKNNICLVKAELIWLVSKLIGIILLIIIVDTVYLFIVHCLIPEVPDLYRYMHLCTYVYYRFICGRDR